MDEGSPSPRATGVRPLTHLLVEGNDDHLVNPRAAQAYIPLLNPGSEAEVRTAHDYAIVLRTRAPTDQAVAAHRQ